MNSLVEKGFINYYGMQRFGHCHHEDGFLLAPVIGHLMLQDEPVSCLSLFPLSQRFISCPFFPFFSLTVRKLLLESIVIL